MEKVMIRCCGNVDAGECAAENCAISISGGGVFVAPAYSVGKCIAETTEKSRDDPS